MPNHYATAQPAGTILVPTPNGLVPMTLADARAYQASHQYGATDPANPNLTPQLRQQIQDPAVQRALQSGATTTVQVGDTKFRIERGQLTSYSVGGIWKPLAAAAATAATGGLAGAYVGGTAAGTAGATGTAGSAAPAAALGPSTPAALAETANIVGGSTVPASLSAAGVPAGASTLSRVGNWLTGGLGSTLAQVGGNLAAVGISSSGIAHAADVEAQVQREALAYEKQRDQYLQQLEAQRYGELGQRLQPYISTGQNASARMASLLGLPAASPYTPSAPIPTNPNAVPPGPYPTRPGLDTTQPPIGQAVPRPGSVTNPNPSQLLPRPQLTAPLTVVMQAPDGTTKQVPAAHVPFYESRGAQIVSA